MKCSQCGFELPDGSESCRMCGVIFSKIDETPKSVFSPSPVSFSREDLINLGLGLGGAAVFLALPFLRWILQYLMVLVHEFGHAIFAWIFAYPAIPRFDFYYGGGVATWQERSVFIYLMLIAGYGVLLYLARRNRTALIAFGALAVLYIPIAATDAHMVLILFMGHGTELLFSGIFLYRAMTGSAVITPLERPLYAACGFTIVIEDTYFAWRLLTSPYSRWKYGQQKGGGHMGDFDRIAIDYFGVDLEAVALFFLICCFVPLIVSFLLARYRQYWHPLIWEISNIEEL